jgi:hypothetical protein
LTRCTQSTIRFILTIVLFITFTACIIQFKNLHLLNIKLAILVKTEVLWNMTPCGFVTNIRHCAIHTALHFQFYQRHFDSPKSRSHFALCFHVKSSIILRVVRRNYKFFEALCSEKYTGARNLEKKTEY